MIIENGGHLPVEEMKMASKLNASSNADAAVTVTAPDATDRLVAVKVFWSYSGDPTGGKLTITGDDANFELDITKGGPGCITLAPYVCNRATALVATLAAGGSGVTGKINLSYYTKRYA